MYANSEPELNTEWLYWQENPPGPLGHTVVDPAIAFVDESVNSTESPILRPAIDVIKSHDVVEIGPIVWTVPEFIEYSKSPEDGEFMYLP